MESTAATHEKRTRKHGAKRGGRAGAGATGALSGEAPSAHFEKAHVSTVFHPAASGRAPLLRVDAIWVRFSIFKTL